MIQKDDLRKLYEQYGSALFHRAKSILKNEEAAWEAVQDSFVKAIQYSSSFRGDSSPWTWLYRIVTNHCLNLIRSQKAWMKAADGYAKEQMRLTSEPQESENSVLINKDWFVKIMSDEDELTQKIIFCYYFDDMPQEEIVKYLGVSRKTIYKRLKKFMEKAKGKLS